jgi:hypothetical protein
VCKETDGVANGIHQKLAEATELTEDRSPYYKHTPATVLENDNFKLYWNRIIITDKTIFSSRPDITFMNKETKEAFLIDIAVPNTQNLARTILDTQKKYQELAHEICAARKQNSSIIYWSNSKVTITKSKTTQLAPQYIYTNAKICNSRHLFNCKKLSKL